MHFGEEFQSILPPQISKTFSELLRDSLTKPRANVFDITYQGNTTSVAYQPVSLENHSIGTLYISASHSLAENVEVDQPTVFFSVIIYIVIALIALGIALVILTSNKRLHALDSKTSEA